MVPLNADCDLYWDHQTRFPEGQPPVTDESLPRLVPFVILCEAYPRDSVRTRPGINQEVWRHIEQNQDERYHRFPSAPIGNPPNGQVPELVFDFKKTFAVATRALYEGLGHGVHRMAMTPPVYLHDFIHRFYSFHSRVALPE